MVTTVRRNSRPAGVTSAATLVELVGPAGAGKTTLAARLTRPDSGLHKGAAPYVPHWADVPFFAKYGLQQVPLLLRLYDPAAGRPRRREVAWLILLHGWHQRLTCAATQPDQITVLDQGPVYMLAQVRDFGSRCLHGRTAERWWTRTCARWASLLTVVVWLDADDDILARRIHQRDEWHALKGRPDDEVFDFLARWRAAYVRVLAELTNRRNGPEILRFDSGLASPAEIESALLIELGRLRERNGMAHDHV